MTVTKTAAGVLTAITGHGPSPPEEGDFSSTYSWSPPSGSNKSIDQKEHHPALPKHPGSTMKDRPPRQHSRALWPPHNNPITSGSCDDPRFTGVLPPVFGALHRYCTLRGSEFLLTYTAATPIRVLFSNEFRDYHFWTILHRKGVSGNES
ncbi:hypothetical protein AVEN_133454-1 [Araneus ventricosus]|uniref:Uncharacterized protein n=1 Tax=Araneus ventricosus TaxID=182803 RepID=A0A4Y2H9Z3_ARAVE|nr:hypothetical protein AVEN_133454-1 [Araneus ventricosus]